MFLSYPDWKAQQLEARAESLVNCPECQGEGVIDTECDCCGEEKEGECDRCDAQGRVYFSDLTPAELNETLSVYAYQRAVLADAKDLAEWEGIEIHEALRKHGLAPYSEFTVKRSSTLSFSTPQINLDTYYRYQPQMPDLSLKQA